MKKEFRDLKFTDDFMFCNVLERNPDLCKEITEVILGQKIKEIVKIDQQHAIRSTPDGHGVRFDVYFASPSSNGSNMQTKIIYVLRSSEYGSLLSKILRSIMLW